MPIWLAQLLSAESSDALERVWFGRGDVRAMPPTYRVRRPSELLPSGSPPTIRCLLHPVAVHRVDDAASAACLERDDVLRAFDEIWECADLATTIRRLRKLNHDLAAARTQTLIVPCLAVWRAWAFARRYQRPWATYMREEWNIDTDKPFPSAPTRTSAPMADVRLLMVASSMIGFTRSIRRAIDVAFDDPETDNPCEMAATALSHVFGSTWTGDAAAMSSGPIEDQRLAAGSSLAARVLAAVSRGHSGSLAENGGRIGADLDKAIHFLGHQDLSVPCSRAHDDYLIGEILPLIWQEQVAIGDIAAGTGPTSPDVDARLQKLVNRLTYQIRKQHPDSEQALSPNLESQDLDPEVEFERRQAVEGHNDDLLAQIILAAEQLPPRQRQIFDLHVNRRLSFSQIADELGLKKGGVTSSWDKAMIGIRRRLASEARAPEVSE
jgi:hypothetical protein